MTEDQFVSKEIVEEVEGQIEKLDTTYFKAKDIEEEIDRGNTNIGLCLMHIAEETDLIDIYHERNRGNLYKVND